MLATFLIKICLKITKLKWTPWENRSLRCRELFPGDLSTSHFNLRVAFHCPFVVTQMNPGIQHLRGKEALLSMTACFQCLTRAHWVVSFAKMPDYPTPTNPMKCFEWRCHLFNANTRYFPRPVCVGLNWTVCSLSCHLGVGPSVRPAEGRLLLCRVSCLCTMVKITGHWVWKTYTLVFWKIGFCQKIEIPAKILRDREKWI